MPLLSQSSFSVFSCYTASCGVLSYSRSIIYIAREEFLIKKKHRILKNLDCSSQTSHCLLSFYMIMETLATGLMQFLSLLYSCMLLKEEFLHFLSKSFWGCSHFSHQSLPLEMFGNIDTIF